MFDSSDRETDLRQSENFNSINSTATARPYHHSVTTLPVFGQEVSSTVTTGGAVTNWAKFALFLLDEGYLSSDEASRNPIELVNIGMKNFLEREVGQIEVAELIFKVTPQITDHGFSNYMVGSEEFQVPEDNTELYLIITPNICRWYAIGKKLTEIEIEVPGLGKTAYYWLATKGMDLFGIMTPYFATQNVAPPQWWFGTENQKDYLEEREAYTEDEDDEWYQPSPDDWKAAFPDYVTNPNATLDIDRLKEIANTHSDDSIKQIAALTVRIAEHEKFTLPHVHHTEYQSVYSPVYLLWEPNDMLNRLTDDFFQTASETMDYYTEDLGLLHIKVDDIQAMKEMLSNLRKGFTQFKNFEQLINLIGVQP